MGGTSNDPSDETKSGAGFGAGETFSPSPLADEAREFVEKLREERESFFYQGVGVFYVSQTEQSFPIDLPHCLARFRRAFPEVRITAIGEGKGSIDVFAFVTEPILDPALMIGVPANLREAVFPLLKEISPVR